MVSILDEDSRSLNPNVVTIEQATPAPGFNPR